MLKIEILKAGMYTSIQDSGRYGYRFYGIPTSGYMDHQSADLANLIVANELGSPLLEFNYQGGKLKFDQTCEIALTGADLNWKVDGLPINQNSLIEIQAGQILTGSYTKSGMRAYLAIGGELINGQEHLGSTSTYPYAKLGGIDGRILKAGDSLEHKTTMSHSALSIKGGGIQMDVKEISIKKGPEFSLMSTQNQDQFLKQYYKIGPDSDRMGAKLIPDQKISNISAPNRLSQPTFPGVIQLLPSGDLIVLLQDGQTTGGYPRIAFIPSDELSLFNQIRIGGIFKFIQ